jgi:hypothetical protein
MSAPAKKAGPKGAGGKKSDADAKKGAPDAKKGNVDGKAGPKGGADGKKRKNAAAHGAQPPTRFHSWRGELHSTLTTARLQPPRTT